MRIVVSGATGLLGRALTSKLIENGDSVAVLTRNVQKAKEVLPLGIDVFHWDPSALVPPSESLEGGQAVVHLTGETIQGRWTKTKKDRILQSREMSTCNLVSAISAMETPPLRVVSASAVGYYGDRGNEKLTESSKRGEGFLSDVVGVWEGRLEPLSGSGININHLRLGVILSEYGGALKQMVLPWRLGLGVKIGDGSQWWPWIHIDDAVGLIEHALKGDMLGGPVNAVAPEQVTQTEFANALARALGRPRIFRVPEFLIRALIGEMSCELTASRRVVVSDTSYKYRFPSLDKALRNLLPQGRDKNHGLKIFQTEMQVDAPIDTVFDFFANPANLEEITPPWLNFKVMSPQSLDIGFGTIIDYRLHLHRVPVTWQSQITEWDPPRRFVDVQNKGPYRHWEHIHEFTSYEGRTLVRDSVKYKVPGGSMVDKLLVRRDLERIFAYRQRKLRELLVVKPMVS